MGCIGPHGQPQPRFIPGLEGRKNKPVIIGRVGPVQPGIKGAHGGAQLQPDGFGQLQDRGGLRAQIQGAVKLEVQADIAGRIMPGDHLTDALIDRLKPVDQREMGARQGAAGQFRFQQGPQGGQFFDPVIGQGRG